MKKAVFAYFATTTAALAHPGHGEPVGHWISHPDHIVGVIVLAVVGGALFALLRSRE